MEGITKDDRSDGRVEMYIAATIGLALFLAYDIGAMKNPNGPVARCAFRAGALCWTFAEGCIAVRVLSRGEVQFLRAIPFALLALVFFLLMVYSLFFAIPFRGAPSGDAKENRVCDTGVYALCRHPGVMWMLLMQLCVYLALPGTESLYGGLTLGVMNILYILFQEWQTFPATLTGYRQYRKETPFLIPSPASIRRCVQTLRRKGNMA